MWSYLFGRGGAQEMGVAGFRGEVKPEELLSEKTIAALQNEYPSYVPVYVRYDDPLGKLQKSKYLVNSITQGICKNDIRETCVGDLLRQVRQKNQISHTTALVLAVEVSPRDRASFHLPSPSTSLQTLWKRYAWGNMLHFVLIEENTFG